MNAIVVAVTSTYHRPVELRRLAACLAGQRHPVAAWVAGDNGDDPETASCMAGAAARVEVVRLPGNPGCGAGLKRAMQRALECVPDLTHFWVLDDDAVPGPECLEELVRSLAETGVAVAAPILTERAGGVQAFPEPVEPRLRRLCRTETAAAALSQVLPEPHYPMAWCNGPCLLVARWVVDQAGFHREDFWMMGEDVEFSLRMCHAGRGVGVRDVHVGHYRVEEGISTHAAELNHLIRFHAHLQNHFFICGHLRHRAHLPGYLPGNLKRLVLTFGVRARVLCVAVHALWWGGVRGQPAGTESGRRMRSWLAAPDGPRTERAD